MKSILALVTVASILLLSAFGCSDAPKASAACASSSAAVKESDECSKCCTANNAKGYKYMNGACSCLNGD